MAYRIIATTCNRRVDRALLGSLKKGTSSINLKVRHFRIFNEKFHNKIFHSQLKHDVAFLTKNIEKLSLFEAFLNEIRVLGFDKFFKPPKSSSSNNEETKSENKEEPPKSAPSPAPSKSAPETKTPPDWNFGMFGPQHGPKSNNSGNKGQGRPIGDQNPDQNKMLLYGAAGFVAFVVAMTYLELGYKEISWKDFTNK